jgi:hypothetical protein
MLKQVKRTSGAIIQRRQGIDHKFQDLTARICIGGRIDMQIHWNPGALKQNGSTEPWIFDPTAVAAVNRAVDTVHVSTIDQPKGYPLIWSGPSAGDRTALDVSMRRVAAGMPGQGGDGSARRRFAGASPGRGSRRPKRVRVSATRSGEACTHA